MQRLTQTRPNNCWQTCVAMLLGVIADQLPDQTKFDRQGYAEALRTYLAKHHNKTYAEIGTDKFDAAKPFVNRGHIMIGETVRTEDHGMWHAVVGIGGKVEWDVHPSRAGLTTIERWGVLLDLTEMPSEWQREGECYCSACISVSTGSSPTSTASSVYGANL